MALAMGNFASMFLFSKRKSSHVLQAINAKVSLADLQTMQRFGMENSDGFVDKAEFIILCMLRIGAVDEKLVEAIVHRYERLDVSRDGLLSYTELLAEDRDGDSEEEGRSAPLPLMSSCSAKRHVSASLSLPSRPFSSNSVVARSKTTTSRHTHAPKQSKGGGVGGDETENHANSTNRKDHSISEKRSQQSTEGCCSRELSSKHRHHRITLRVADELASRVTQQQVGKQRRGAFHKQKRGEGEVTACTEMRSNVDVEIAMAGGK
jgi:hypothetical protein